MPDIWILVFIVRGVLATSGTTMPLDECLLRLSVNSAQQAFCVNAALPMCKVYKNREHRRKEADRCIEWLEAQ